MDRAEFIECSLVLVVSLCERQRGEFVRKASEFVSALGHVLRGEGDNRTSLLFPSGSRSVGLSDVLSYAVKPMLAVSDGNLWMMSTPRGKQGFFYNEWQNGSADASGAGHGGVGFADSNCVSGGERNGRKSDGIYWQEYECEFAAIDGARRMVTNDCKPLVHV